MKNLLTVLGIVLGAACFCLLIALTVEIYYLFKWRKQRITSQEHHQEEVVLVVNNLATLNTNNNNKTINSNGAEVLQADLEFGGNNNNGNKEVNVRSINGIQGEDDHSIEAELMRLHNLAGPPRFLFTINEESREGLESEDQSKSRFGTGNNSKRGSITRSLSDIIVTVDSFNATPLASPPIKSPNLRTQLENLCFGGVNPLFGSTEADLLSRVIKSSSPPSKFKFLRDAEGKFLRRVLLEELEKKGLSFSSLPVGVQDCLVREHRERNLPQCPSDSSQVLPPSVDTSHASNDATNFGQELEG